MNDLVRRYFLFAGTARGRKIIAALFIGVALALDVAGSLLASDGRHSHEAGTLFGLATGVILVGVIFILLNRRPR
jgi:hypothetical protein